MDPSVKVLVVDDNRVNLKVTGAYLSRFNVQADLAESGSAAIELAKRKKYDLVFMDHLMPDMDGIEASARIRALDSGEWYKTVPIVALTADAVDKAKELFLQGGMNDILLKPIEEKELNRVLARWLPTEKIRHRSPMEDAASGNVPPAFPAARAPRKSFSGEREQALDTALGLVNSAGDKKLYVQLLGDFKRNHLGDLDAIRSAREAGDLKSAGRLAHTLKSSAAIIGAEPLRKAALDVENSLDGDAGEKPEALGASRTLDALMAKLGLAFAALIPELDRLISGSGPPPGGLPSKASGGGPDSEQALALIQKLKSLLETSDSAVLDLRDEIAGVLAPLGEKGEELLALVDNFEFPRAAKVLSEIWDALSP